MPSTQKGLVTGLSVCDRDSVVICTWSALPPTCDVAWAPINRMGRNDSRTHNECVQLLIYLSSSNVTPVEMIQPLRPAEKSVSVHACAYICEGVEGWAGRGRCVLDDSLRGCVWCGKGPYDFPGCVCTDWGNMLVKRCVWEVESVYVRVCFSLPDTDSNFDGSLLNI